MTGGWGTGEWGLMPWGGGDVATLPGTAVTYRLVLATRGTSGLGTPIISDVLAVGVPMDTDAAGRWSRTLNAAGTLEFSLPIDACTPDDFAPGQRELHLYRDDGAGDVLVWAGHLWTADVRAPWVRFLGMGFYEALRHREISDDFYKQSVEQRSIAWQLIDYTQSETGGALGITRETAAGSAVQRTVLYCAEERQVIADAIEDLASADDGFDFEVGPDKVWRTWTPERGTDLSASVELDTTESIVDMSYTIDGTQVENDVAGIGSKGDCEPIHFVREVDINSRDAYGLMQGTVSRSDIKSDDDLITALASERLALLKDARKQPTVRMFQGLDGPSPLSGDFRLGDTIAVRSSWGYATFHERFRLMSYQVSFDRVGNEMLELVLDSRGRIAAPTPYTMTIAASTTLAPSVTKPGQTNLKAVAASTTVSPAIHRQMKEAIAIGPGAPRGSIDVTTSLTPAIGKRITKTIAASTSLTPTMDKKLPQTLVDVVTTLAPTITRRFTKTIAASTSFTAAITNHVSPIFKTIAATTSITTTVNRRLNKLIAAGTLLGAATWDSATALWDSTHFDWNGLNLGATPMLVSLTKKVTKAVAVTTTLTPVRSFLRTKAIAATTTFTSGISPIKVKFLRTIAATTTLTLGRTKLVRKAIAAVPTIAAAQFHRITHTVPATTTITPTVQESKITGTAGNAFDAGFDSGFE